MKTIQHDIRALILTLTMPMRTKYESEVKKGKERSEASKTQMTHSRKKLI